MILQRAPGRELVVYAPRARPSGYDDEIATIICERMIEGESLIDICRDEDMPSRATVYRWMDANPTFETRCARAREGLADVMDHKIMAVAEASTPETFNADKVKISAYQWRAAKLNPRRYGEKSSVEVTGANGGPVQLEAVRETLIERAARLAAPGPAPELHREPECD